MVVMVIQVHLIILILILGNILFVISIFHSYFLTKIIFFNFSYGGVATYNGGGNDDYYSGNSYSQGII